MSVSVKCHKVKHYFRISNHLPCVETLDSRTKCQKWNSREQKGRIDSQDVVRKIPKMGLSTVA